jgi:hypothetical protein
MYDEGSELGGVDSVFSSIKKFETIEKKTPDPIVAVRRLPIDRILYGIKV